MRDIYDKNIKEINIYLKDAFFAVHSQISIIFKFFESQQVSIIDIENGIIDSSTNIINECQQYKHNIFILLLRQQPVANELRFLLVAIQIIYKICKISLANEAIGRIMRIYYPDNFYIRYSIYKKNILFIIQSIIDILLTLIDMWESKSISSCVSILKIKDNLEFEYDMVLQDNLNNVHDNKKVLDIIICNRYFIKIADNMIDIYDELFTLCT